MTIEEHEDPATDSLAFTIRTTKMELAMYRGTIVQELMRTAAHELAAQFLRDHAQEVLAEISPKAVATMAMAEAAAAVNETLHKKLPDKVLVVEHARRWW